MNTSSNKSRRTHTYAAALPHSPNTSSRPRNFLRKTFLSFNKKIRRQIRCVQRAFASINPFFCFHKPVLQFQIKPKSLQEFAFMSLVLDNQFAFSSLKKTSSSTLSILQLPIAFYVGLKPCELSLHTFTCPTLLSLFNSCLSNAIFEIFMGVVFDISGSHNFTTKYLYL